MRHDVFCLGNFRPRDFRLAGWLLAGALSLGLWTGCQTIRTTARPVPFANELRCGQIVLHSDITRDAHQRLIDQLCAQRETLASKLGLPTTDRPIHIYLFADDTSYHDFVTLRFPGFTSRRAIFVDTEVEMAVYAYWGDHTAEDLRHEVTHGYLHAALPRLPLWLDEGLAEYFEGGPSQHGLNAAHLEFLSGASEFQPDLTHLERLTDAAEMTQRDYAEAWAWVHFLLESDVDKSQLLTSYLADLQQGETKPLSTELQKRLAGPELALREHLQALR